MMTKRKRKVININKLSSSHMTGEHYFVKRGYDNGDGLIEATSAVNVTKQVKKIVVDHILKYVNLDKEKPECLYCQSTEDLSILLVEPKDKSLKGLTFFNCKKCK